MRAAPLLSPVYEENVASGRNTEADFVVLFTVEACVRALTKDTGERVRLFVVRAPTGEDGAQPDEKAGSGQKSDNDCHESEVVYRDAAIYDERRSGRPRGLVGGEVDSGVDDVLGPSEASQRDAAEALEALLFAGKERL